MSKLTLKEIAKLVRSNLAAAVKSGELPKGIKVSVRTDYYSMGQALRVYVTALPEGFPVANAARIAFDRENPHADYFGRPEAARARLAPEAAAVLAKVEDIASEHRERTVDSYSGDDIVNQNYHLTCDIDSDLTNADQKRIEAKLDAEAAVAAAPVAPAPRPRVYLRADCAPALKAVQ